MSKSSFLVFNTDYSAEMKSGNIKDGKVTIDKKEYIPDKAHPIWLKKGFGSRPLYLLKWNCLEPVYPNVKEEIHSMTDDTTQQKINFVKKDIEFLTHPPNFKEGDKVTPEILASTQDMRFIKGMKKYGGGGFDLGGAGSKMPLIILFIVIFTIGFLMTYGYQVGWFKGIM